MTRAGTRDALLTSLDGLASDELFVLPAHPHDTVLPQSFSLASCEVFGRVGGLGPRSMKRSEAAGPRRNRLLDRLLAVGPTDRRRGWQGVDASEVVRPRDARGLQIGIDVPSRRDASCTAAGPSNG